jgi:hypothetical protein
MVELTCASRRLQTAWRQALTGTMVPSVPRSSISSGIGHFTAMSRVVQKAHCIQLTDKPIHGCENVVARGTKRAIATTFGHENHVPWIGRISSRHEEGNHVLHIAFTSLKRLLLSPVVDSDKQRLSTSHLEPPLKTGSGSKKTLIT